LVLFLTGISIWIIPGQDFHRVILVNRVTVFFYRILLIGSTRDVMIPKNRIRIISAVFILTCLFFTAGCTNTIPQSVPPQPDITKTEIKTVPVGDITIAYKEIGSGDPLILIMGYSGAMDLWDTRVVNMLARQYRVIIFDNRGMGRTTSSDTEYTIRLFAADTAGLMDARGIKKAHVMGWSMGTLIAQELTLDYPDKVDKLILYAGNTGGKEALPPSPEVIAVLENTTGTEREIGERFFKELFPPAWLKENPDPSIYFPKITSMNPAGNVKRQAAAIVAWNGSYSRLVGMKQPLLLITGDQDVLTPPGNSLIIAQNVPHSWMVRIRGGGHGVMYQYPDAFAGIVSSFLSYGT
jgi:pimeloyl-ACP methyl ester carboxylesterase